MFKSFAHRLAFTVAFYPLASCGTAAEPQMPVAPARPNTHIPLTSTAQTARYTSFIGEMPTAVTSFGATGSGKHVYVLGGYSGEPHHYTKEGQSDVFARFDVTSGAWESLAPLGAFQSATLDPIGNKLVRVGGMRVENSAGAPTDLHSVADVDLFDLETRTWSKATPLPEARSSHGTAIVDDEIYVIGGWALDGAMGSGTWASTMLIGRLDGGTITWKAQSAPIRSRALGVAALGQHIIAVGGMDGRRVQRTTYVYDTQSGSWSIGPEFPEPAFGVALTSMGEHVFASASSGAVYVLNAARTAWEPYGQLTFPRFFHAMVAVEDRLVALGGVPGDHSGARVRHIEQLGPSNGGITSFTLDAPSRAKNRQGIFVAGNSMYLFGGNQALGQHDFAPTNFLQEHYRLDLGSFTWTQLTPFPHAAQSMQGLVTSHGIGVASGGFGPKGSALMSSPEVFHYDFELDQWSQAEVFPESRTQFGLAEYDKALWVFGGMTFDDSQKDSQFKYPTSVLQRPLDSTERFTPSTIKTPRERRAFAWATLNDTFYMIGGMAEGFSLVSECDAFDFEHKTWHLVPCPSRVRIGAEMVSLNDKLYLIAGRSKPTAEAALADDPRVEVYDPQTRTWSVVLDKLPIADTHQLRAFPFRDKILIYTAQREDQRVQLVLIDPKALPSSAANSVAAP